MNSSQNRDIVFSLYNDKRTVFRLIDIAMLTGETDLHSLTKKVNHYVRTGKIQNLRQGIYAKKGYNPEELAVRIFTPS